MQEGYGLETYEDCSTYEGMFKEGMKNGMGTFKSSPSDPQGTIYSGTWLNDKIDGSGE